MLIQIRKYKLSLFSENRKLNSSKRITEIENKQVLLFDFLNSVELQTPQYTRTNGSRAKTKTRRSDKIRHGPHTEWHIQQLILRCHGKASIKLMPINDRKINKQIHRHTRPTILLLLRVYVASGTCSPHNHRRRHTDTQTDLWSSRWNGLRCHDTHIKFHKDWFRHSKIDEGWGASFIEHCYYVSLL
jgi:hypothetical protein